MTISATTRGLRPGVCTSSTRPSSPFDGQLIYETDTNRVAVYDTNAWVYKTPASTTGSVLQVVSTIKTDAWSQSNSGGGDFDVTGLSATITPSSTSSKILIMASVSKGAYGGVIFKRDSTVLAPIGDASGSRTRAFMTGTAGAAGMSDSISPIYLDSPASTSALVYKVAIRDNHSPAAVTMYVNRSDADVNQIYDYRTASSITVMEIAG